MRHVSLLRLAIGVSMTLMSSIMAFTTYVDQISRPHAPTHHARAQASTP